RRARPAPRSPRRAASCRRGRTHRAGRARAAAGRARCENAGAAHRGPTSRRATPRRDRAMRNTRAPSPASRSGRPRPRAKPDPGRQAPGRRAGLARRCRTAARGSRSGDRRLAQRTVTSDVLRRNRPRWRGVDLAGRMPFASVMADEPQPTAEPGAPVAKDAIDPELVRLGRPRPKVGLVTAAGLVLLSIFFLVRLSPDRRFSGAPEKPARVSLADVL